MDHSNQVKTANKSLFAAIVFFILPISGVAIDIYVPSLPAVAQYFNVDKSWVQLSITFYMMGLGFMQLFAGGITDSFGRRKPTLVGMFVFIIATFYIPFVSDIYQLLLLRLVQGIMVAVIVVPLRSVIPDIFEGHKLHEMLNYMVVFWSIGPIIAPFIGGYLQHYFSWKANFYFLGFYSVLAFFLVWFFLPETSVHRHPFHPIKMLERYKTMVFNWQYTAGLLSNGLLYAIAILFAIVGPFLIQGVMHYSAIEFGQMSLLVGLFWFLGAMTNRFLLHIPLELKAKVCLSFMLLVSLSMLWFSLYLKMTVYIIVPPILLLTWFGGIIFPNYFARVVSLFPTMTGSANALFGSFIFLIAGLSSGLGAYLKSSSQLPLSITYVVLVICCFILYYSSLSKTKTR